MAFGNNPNKTEENNKNKHVEAQDFVPEQLEPTPEKVEMPVAEEVPESIETVVEVPARTSSSVPMKTEIPQPYAINYSENGMTSPKMGDGDEKFGFTESQKQGIDNNKKVTKFISEFYKNVELKTRDGEPVEFTYDLKTGNGPKQTGYINGLSMKGQHLPILLQADYINRTAGYENLMGQGLAATKYIGKLQEQAIKIKIENEQNRKKLYEKMSEQTLFKQLGDVEGLYKQFEKILIDILHVDRTWKPLRDMEKMATKEVLNTLSDLVFNDSEYDAKFKELLDGRFEEKKDSQSIIPAYEGTVRLNVPGQVNSIVIHHDTFNQWVSLNNAYRSQPQITVALGKSRTTELEYITANDFVQQGEEKNGVTIAPVLKDDFMTKLMVSYKLAR